MMYKLSDSSSKKLSTCDDRLQQLFNEVLKKMDFTVACGHRTMEEQNEEYKSGRSQLQYPNSKHNTYPSLAIDVYPYVNKRMVNGSQKYDLYQICFFAGIVKATADQLNIPIIWGGDWNNDYIFDALLNEKSFQDLPHFELIFL